MAILGTKAKVLLGVLLLLVVGVVLFDWNWLRRPVEDYLTERSGREVRIGHLQVEVGLALEPTVTLRDVHIQNATWADKRPFADAGEVALTFSLRSVWAGHPVISRLLLVDADINLEREADGRRNWRLRDPDNLERGRTRILHLEARRSRIRFIRRDDYQFEIVAESHPLESVEQVEGKQLTQRVEFHGELRGTKFAGEALTGDVLTLRESGELFPIRGHVTAEGARLEVAGEIADLFRPTAMRGQVRLSTESLSRLHAFVPGRLPATKPFALDARIEQSEGRFSLTQVRARLGGTAMAGEASLDTTGERSLLQASLASDSANTSDFDFLVPKDKADPEAVARKAFDAQVQLHARKLTVPGMSAVQSAKVAAHLTNGVLALKPVDIGLAGGNVTGTVEWDSTKQPASVEANLEARDVRLESLLAGSRLERRMAGPLAAHIDVRGRGESVADLLAGVSGRVEASVQNAVISNLVDAALNMDLAKIMRALVTGDKAVGINRVDVAFDFDHGLGQARNIFFDSEQTRATGTGRIDLRDKTLDVLITPKPKKPRILALDSSIRVDGRIARPRIHMEKVKR